MNDGVRFQAVMRGFNYAIYGWRHDGRFSYAAEPVTITYTDVPEGADWPHPMLTMGPTEAEALYLALGEALGRWTPAAEFSMEVFRSEQKRVDRLIDALITGGAS